MVTIIADTQAVSRQVELELGLDGTPVQRIAGSVAEVAAALAARVAAGQPFV
jgi:putative cell wall-binding protein